MPAWRREALIAFIDVGRLSHALWVTPSHELVVRGLKEQETVSRAPVFLSASDGDVMWPAASSSCCLPFLP